jgi:hypothetical protein
VGIHPSARRHGIADKDILHAIEHSPVIHAMALRAVYRKLLDP